MHKQLNPQGNLYYVLQSCSGLAPLRLAHPQTPTTTPLCRRVAKNPHIDHHHHGHKSMTRDGR